MRSSKDRKVYHSGQCMYHGLWTRKGCNEWAERGAKYCHAHQAQGSTAKLRAVLVVVFVAAIGGSCGICGIAMLAGG